jgi:hypothetical protein
VKLLGWGISAKQGLYLHRTARHRKTKIHAVSGIQTRDLIDQAMKVYASERQATGADT